MATHWFEVSFHERAHAEHLGMEWVRGFYARKIESTHENFNIIKSLFKEITDMDELQERAAIKVKEKPLVAKFMNMRDQINHQAKKNKENPRLRFPIYLCAHTKKAQDQVKSKGAKFDLVTNKYFIYSNWDLNRFMKWLPAMFFLTAVDTYHKSKKEERESNLRNLSIKLFGSKLTRDQSDIRLANYFANQRIII